MVSKIIRADGTTELASIQSVTYHESVNADIDLRPGCVASSYIEVTCFGAQSDAPAVGEALTYYQVVGSTETLIGIFYAEPSIPTKNSYKFIAYDAVHKLDADFSAWLAANQSVFPTTPYQLVSQACTLAGVTLGSSSWGYSTMEVNAFYADGLTCRNILQYAAEVGCSFVRCNTSGEVIFDWYSTVSNQRIYPSSGTSGSEVRYAYKESGLNYENYSTSAIARVAVHPVGVDGAAYVYPTNVTSGNTLNITNNLMLYGKAESSMVNIATSMYNRMTSLGTYRPMTVDMFPNECPFSAGQKVAVTDAQGVSFTTVIMEKTVTDSAVTLTSTGREVYGDYALDTAKQLVQLAADIVRINKLKVDWAEIGTAIIDTLEANGINADWINAGALTVRDTNNNIIFQADQDTKTVQMGGWSADSSSLQHASSDYSGQNVKLSGGGLEFGANGARIYGGGRSIQVRLSDGQTFGGVNRFQVQYGVGSTVYTPIWLEVTSAGSAELDAYCDFLVSGNFTHSGSNSSVSIGNPSAWRAAIGLGTNGVLPITVPQGGTGHTAVQTYSTISDIVTAGTNISITSAGMSVWGKMAMLSLTVKANSAIASGDVLATIVAGKRAAIGTYCLDSSNGRITVYPNGQINTNHAISSGASVAINATYLLAN